MKNMMDRVVAHAKEVLASGDTYLFALHALNEDGNLYVLICPYSDAEEKRRLYNTLRLWTVAKGVEHYVVCSEAWLVVSDDGDRSKFPKDLSQAAGREEVLICVEVQRKNGKRVGRGKTFIIRRNDEGKVTDLELIKYQKDTNFSGDLFDFIPPTQPPADAKKMAEEALKIGRALGYVPEMKPILIPIKGGKS